MDITCTQRTVTWKVANSGVRGGVFPSAVLCQRKTAASISKDRICIIWFFLPFFAMSYGHRTFLAGWHFLSPSYFRALSLSHSLFTSCQAVPGAAIIPHPSSIPFFSIQEWACWGSAALNFTSCVGIFFLYFSGGFHCFVCGWFWVSLVAVCFLASISPVCEAGDITLPMVGAVRLPWGCFILTAEQWLCCVGLGCSQPAEKARQSPLTETSKKSHHPNLLSHGDFWLQSPWHLESALVSEKVYCGAC